MVVLEEKLPGFLNTALTKRWKLPSILKKQQVSALLLLDIRDRLPVSVPQFLLMKDQAVYTAKEHPVLRQLAGIVVSSGAMKTALVENAGVDVTRIIVVEGLLAPGLKPADIREQLAFKDQVTQGREFFLCADASWTKDGLLLLLKAFSRFKKMQQSNWKLLITQRGNDPKTAAATAFDILGTYKYREDVQFFTESNPGDYALVLGAAYAAITLQQDAGFPAAACEALVCHTPVLAPEALQHRIGADITVFDAASDASLGKCMMELYKNEALRQQLAVQTVVADPEAGLELLRKRLLQA